MPEKNENDIVGMLREKTKEADLEQFLKSRLGGYTKKSVLEYLSVLKKQQQASADTFSENLKSLFNEKETLTTTNERLLARLKKVESEYQNLSDAMAAFKLENKDFSFQDIVNLKGTISALEAENKKLSGINHERDRTIERLNSALGEKEKELEQSQQDARLQKELLIEEKGESKKQRELVANISGAVDELQDENQYLKSQLTEGKISELTTQISKLMVNNAAQDEVIQQLRRELTDKENTIQACSDENAESKQTIGRLKSEAEQMLAQNEKLNAAKKTLSLRLEEMHRHMIALINEKSDETVEKLVVSRKLDAAHMKISLLEMEQRKSKKAQEVEAASRLTENAADGITAGSSAAPK